MQIKSSCVRLDVKLNLFDTWPSTAHLIVIFLL